MVARKWLISGLVMILCLVPGQVQSAALAPGIYPGPSLPIATENNWKYSPAIAYDSLHDEYLVVWENIESSPSGNIHDIYARRISASGLLLGEFEVASGAFDRKQPDVAYDSAHDRYLVVWSYDSWGDATDFDIMGRFIPWNGPDPLIGEFAIETSREISDKPRVVYGTTFDELMVLWKVESTPTAIEGGARYSNGTWSPALTIYNGAGDADFPDLAYNQVANEFIAVWDVQNAGTGLDIYAARITWDAKLIGSGPFTIANTSASEQHPAVASCSSVNQYLVAWQQPVPFQSYDTVVGKRFTGNGTLVGSFIIGTAESLNRPTLACSSAGSEYLAAWENQSTQVGLQGAFFSSDLTVFTVFQIIPPGSSSDRAVPAVASGKWTSLVAWEQGREGTGYRDIYGRILDTNPTFLPWVDK